MGNADAQRRVVHGRRRCAPRRIVHMSIARRGAQRPASSLALGQAAHGLLMFNGFGAGFAQAAKDHRLGPL